MRDMEIRVARSSDAQAIGLLHAENFRENNAGSEFTDARRGEDLPAELLQLWQQRLEQPTENQLVLVALDKANLLGFVCAYGADDGQWGSLIDNLHVGRAARRTGVGSGLMQQACAWLASGYGDSPDT